MQLKQAVIGTGSRILRFIGIIAVIYVSMVFYLALSERRNAFPRAITHKEAEEAIKGTAKNLTCTLSDGTILHGFSIGSKENPTLLYYPGADEDAAQFLAEVEAIEGLNLVTFNYRGSANNKGTPSEETFKPDAKEIAECAAQASEKSLKYLAGRGTGAILAAEQLKSNQILILIDPISSIADALASKYRVLYPKFLVRSKVSMPYESLSAVQNQIKFLFDRKMASDAAHIVSNKLPFATKFERNGSSLKEILEKSIQKN